MIVIAQDPNLWLQLTLYTAVLLLLSVAIQESLQIPSVRKAVAASIWAPFSWVVLSRLEYRHRAISWLFGGHRRLAQIGFATYVLCFSFYREHVFAVALAQARRIQDFPPAYCILQEIGNALFIIGTTMNLTGFFHVHLNTYYPEYFGMIQTKLVTAFPYNLTPHPMYIGAALGHVGYAIRILSPTAMYLALIISLGYWTVAKIFEEPYMHIFYGQKTFKDKVKATVKTSYEESAEGKHKKSSVLFDFVYYVLWKRICVGRSEFQDGTLVALNANYNLRRYVQPTDPATIENLTQQLSTLCESSIGSLLPYPIFQGRNYHDKMIFLVFPKGSQVPCAFNVSILWQHESMPCIHLGLVMVHPEHRGRNLQSLIGLSNAALHAVDSFGQHNPWVTDLGRSASGSRSFCNFFQGNICPYPITESGETCTAREPHLSIAKAFYDKFRPDAGISEKSELHGFVVKNSNGPGGAEALVKVQSTTISTHAKFNKWMDWLCPDPTDEVIMVGKFQFLPFLAKQVQAIIWSWIRVLVAVILALHFSNEGDK